MACQAFARTFLTVALLAHATHALGEEWVTLTLTRDGSWGTASHESRAEATSLAIINCRLMAAQQSDCGSLRTTVQGAWSIGVLCGSYNIVATGQTFAEAVLSVRRRALELRDTYDSSLPQCMHLVTVQPNGIARGRLRPGLVSASSAR
jgi:hypothetical protein